MAKRRAAYALPEHVLLSVECACMAADPFSDPDMTRDRPNEDPFARVATITVAIVGVGGAAVAGTAFALYKEVRDICKFWCMALVLVLSFHILPWL